MRILYLCAEVMGFALATMRELAARGAELHVVHWDTRKLTPFQITDVRGATFYPRSEAPLAKLKSLIDDVPFDIASVAGWMERDYLTIAKALRLRGLPVVCCLDGQWHGTARQQVAGVLGGARYFQRYFSHAWVAGAPQYAYARRLGFTPREIALDALSADLSIFTKDYARAIAEKEQAYPHRFLYVGRFHEEKGTDLLVSAWKSLGAERRDWDLHMIGGGPQMTALGSAPGMLLNDFMQPERLPKEAARAGCFVLPSRRDQWGVVLHEFAAAGLPIICSDVCGAASAFVIPGWNGHIFRSTDAASLAANMKRIIETDDATLLEMGRRSHQLAGKITPETSAANLLSVAFR